jgi:hypothetical protein
LAGEVCDYFVTEWALTESHAIAEVTDEEICQAVIDAKYLCMKLFRQSLSSARH